jgi:hypothetical protein
MGIPHFTKNLETPEKFAGALLCKMYQDTLAETRAERHELELSINLLITSS